jgi:thioredoxin-like negative regulator of GroEL
MNNTLLKFESGWCQACKSLDKVLNQIDLGSTLLVHVDIDHEPDVAKAYNIRGLPTTVLLDSTGEEIKRTIGLKSKEFLEKFLQVEQ